MTKIRNIHTGDVWVPALDANVEPGAVVDAPKKTAAELVKGPLFEPATKPRKTKPRKPKSGKPAKSTEEKS